MSIEIEIDESLFSNILYSLNSCISRYHTRYKLEKFDWCCSEAENNILKDCLKIAIFNLQNKFNIQYIYKAVILYFYVVHYLEYYLMEPSNQMHCIKYEKQSDSKSINEIITLITISDENWCKIIRRKILFNKSIDINGGFKKSNKRKFKKLNRKTKKNEKKKYKTKK